MDIEDFAANHPLLDYLELRDSDELFTELIGGLKDEWAVLNGDIKSGFELTTLTVRTCCECGNVHVNTDQDIQLRLDLEFRGHGNFEDGRNMMINKTRWCDWLLSYCGIKPAESDEPAVIPIDNEFEDISEIVEAQADHRPITSQKVRVKHKSKKDYDRKSLKITPKPEDDTMTKLKMLETEDFEAAWPGTPTKFEGGDEED